jgi:anaerobic selenocysteine-containing dehydrogenase
VSTFGGSASHKSFCRICANNCAVVVSVRGGRVDAVTGDRSDPLFAGYTCVKGRAAPTMMNGGTRVLRPLRRDGDGTFAVESLDRAIDEVAAKVGELIDRYGPRSVATYVGTASVANPATLPVVDWFMSALQSKMLFTPNTIDKAGKDTARALHGYWMAPRQAYDAPEVALLVGANPIVSYQGVPAGNPARWLEQRIADGMKLIVVDPRRTETARRAHLHIQPKPGGDAFILASIARTLITRGLIDEEFVADNTQGLDSLARTLAPFTPERVAERVGIAPTEIVAAAETFGSAPRGYANVGTGGHMGGHGTLTEYMVLVLEALCGHYLRAGERVRGATTLVPSTAPVAQAMSPAEQQWRFEDMHVPGYFRSAAGNPVSALAQEIELDRPDRVRALICIGGNPVAAFPNKVRTLAAMRRLDLLVAIDPYLGQTSRLAHWVIPPTLPYEVASYTWTRDQSTKWAPIYGFADSYAHYTPALVAPPDGSDVIDEWEFLYRLALALDLPLPDSKLGLVRPEPGDESSRRVDLEQILEQLAGRSRVPLAVIRARSGGAFYPNPAVHVAAKEDGWVGRLDLANRDVLADLTTAWATSDPDSYPFRLVTRRATHVHNSSCNVPATHRGRPFNAAFLHPEDLVELGLGSGELIALSGSVGELTAVAMPDSALRRGLVSMSHCYGAAEHEDPHTDGANVNALVSDVDDLDAFSKQPRMTALPIRVSRVAPADEMSLGKDYG